jgi:nucleotide-binding universal stress UspA family protein
MGNILVPLDGSRLAESVLPVARLLARCACAKLTLLHIIEEHAPQSVHGEPHLSSEPEAGAYLEEVARRLGMAGRVELHVHASEEHDVAKSIAEHSVDLGADLVALCTHGNGGLRRALSGSIAQQVLRQVRAPVLLVRPPVQADFRLGTILVALDGMADGEVALPLATALAADCGAALRLVCVVPTVQTVRGDRLAAVRFTPLSADAVLDVEEKEARAYLAALAGKLPKGIDVTTEVRRGDITQELEAAVRVDADIVALATHGRAGWGALWSGSVGAVLSSRLKQPLLLVRII